MAKQGLKSNTPVHTTNGTKYVAQGTASHRGQQGLARAASLNLQTDGPRGRRTTTIIVNGTVVTKYI